MTAGTISLKWSLRWSPESPLRDLQVIVLEVIQATVHQRCHLCLTQGSSASPPAPRVGALRRHPLLRVLRVPAPMLPPLPLGSSQVDCLKEKM